MKELERLLVSGNAQERALLAKAEVPLVPDDLRRRVRLALEERLSASGRRRAARRLALGAVGMLVAGSALAYEIARRPPERAVPSVASPRRHATSGTSSPASPPAPADSTPPRPPPVRRRPPLVTGASPRLAVREPRAELHAPSLGGPALRAPADLGAEPPPAEEAVVAPPPPRLLVARGGQPVISLVLAGDRIVGRARNAAVALTVSRAQIVGHVGDLNVSLWLHGRLAEGSLGGLPVKFELRETRDGYQLREGYALPSALPAHTTRIVTTDTSFTWSPGCAAPLGQIEAGVYQGRCASGSRTRLELPEEWRRLPVLMRLVLLSLFLT